MTKVKICGIRRKEDICLANYYLPDYIGFVFAESKRRVTCSEVRVLSLGLNKSIKKVGVFVNEHLKDVIVITEACGLDVVQIHGDESPEYICSLKEKLIGRTSKTDGSPIEIWKALRVRDKNSLNRIEAFNADAFLLDTFVDGSYGGSGKTFDWKLVCDEQYKKRIVLAGGLCAKNVKNAIECAKPFAVDISSGVETDGFKDELKIRDFINAVRSE